MGKKEEEGLAAEVGLRYAASGIDCMEDGVNALSYWSVLIQCLFCKQRPMGECGQ